MDEFDQEIADPLIADLDWFERQQEKMVAAFTSLQGSVNGWGVFEETLRRLTEESIEHLRDHYSADSDYLPKLIQVL